MQWRNRGGFATRPARPKVRRLDAGEVEQALRALSTAVAKSPVLTAFKLQLRLARGRFYLDWQWVPPEDSESQPRESNAPRPETFGRITPVAGAAQGGEFLLEFPYSRSGWSEYARGTPAAVIQAVANDTAGTFHGLGNLDKSLRAAAKAKRPHRKLEVAGKNRFQDADTGAACSVQEALYYYFGLPIHVIAQPAVWYSRHRKPRITEFAPDRTRVLVDFEASSFSETFAGTCLYALRESHWEAHGIRPNQSESIAAAEAWLVKRKWKSWLTSA